MTLTLFLNCSVQYVSVLFYVPRTIIRNAMNASEHDTVIFVGSGSTAAVHKLIHALNLKTSPVCNVQ